MAWLGPGMVRRMALPAYAWPAPGLRPSNMRSIAKPMALQARGVHFDTNAFVQRLENAGIKREQADVLVTALIDVINESIENFARGLVRRDEADRQTYAQKVDFTKLKSEIQLLERSDFVLMKSENERLMADVEKLKQRLREEITRTTAGVRLDLNLEKGTFRCLPRPHPRRVVGARAQDQGGRYTHRVRDRGGAYEHPERQVQCASGTSTDRLTQYLVGVATGAGALLLAYLRMFR